MTAHYGIVLGHLTAAFGTWHYGGPEYFIAQHNRLEVVVHAVDAGYYALLAFHKPSNLVLALDRLRAAATSCARRWREPPRARAGARRRALAASQRSARRQPGELADYNPRSQDWNGSRRSSGSSRARATRST